MKKIIIALSIVFFSDHLIAQNPSPAEMEKLLKEAKDMLKQFGGDSLADKKLKELEKNESQFKNIVNNSKTETKNTDPTTAKFPVKQVRLINSIPKKTMTKTEVKTFIQQVYSNLKKNIASQYVLSAEKIITQLKNDPLLIMETAIAAAHMNAGEEATLLAAYSASILPEPNLLNNCASIFTIAGLEPAAIPILRSLLPVYSNNTTILNNLGQAYAALGEKDSAMRFFGRCIKLDPTHAQANYCGGVIENSNGNTTKAKEHLKKSLEGGYDPDASRLVRFLDPEFNLSRYAKPPVKVPEYFNIHKFLPFPVPCQSIEDIPRAESEYKEYVKMLDDEIEKIRKIENEISASYAALPMNKGYAVSKGSIMRTSFYKFCSEMNVDIAKEQADLVSRYSEEVKFFEQETRKIDNEYNKAAAAIREEYKYDPTTSCCGEGNTTCCPDYEEMCNKLNALANSYLPKYAGLTQDIQLKVLHPFQNFNEITYWNYLAYSPVPPLGVQNFRGAFYGQVMGFLSTLRTRAYTKIIPPCKLPEKKQAAKREGGEIKEPDCPFELEKEKGPFKFGIDCEKATFEISLADDIKLVYSKENFSKASSIEIEIGIEEKKKLEVIPGYTSSIGGGITESLVIEFDKEGKFSDFQVKGGVKVSASAKIDPKDELIKKVTGTKETFKASEKFNYVFSMKNGFSYEDGLLRPIADKIMGTKPEVQVNKNIGVYKSN